METGADYARADLARIKLVQIPASSDIKGTDGELLPGEAGANTNFVNSPVERLLSPRNNFTSQDLAEPF